VPASNCGVVGMDLLAAKVMLLKNFGAMLFGIRHRIPGASSSTHTVVNPVVSCVLTDRCHAQFPHCFVRSHARNTLSLGSVHCAPSSRRVLLLIHCRSDVLLLAVNKPAPPSWSKSAGKAVEVWKESQLLYDTWKLRAAEPEDALETGVENGGSGANCEDEESSVLLVDLVEVALSLMKEVTSLGKLVAQYSRTAHHGK
jgi:hypothetical protein